MTIKDLKERIEDLPDHMSVFTLSEDEESAINFYTGIIDETGEFNITEIDGDKLHELRVISNNYTGESVTVAKFISRLSGNDIDLIAINSH